MTTVVDKASPETFDALKGNPASAERALPQSARAQAHARAIAEAGGLMAAVERGLLPRLLDTTSSEAVVLGLLKLGVRKYFVIFGHGSTDLGEVLRVYTEEGVTETYNFRNEVSMAHAGTALRWQYGETPAVVTSIGPGALQAMAGSLVASSNGVGVFHIYGDETTQGEGYNMQQIPKREQGLFGQLTALMGESHVLHTPEALRDALRRGSLRVDHPYKPGPFYLLLPLNVQPQPVTVNLNALPVRGTLPKVGVMDTAALDAAADAIRRHARIVIKAGGGTRGLDDLVRRLAEATGAAVTCSPGSTGILPDGHPQFMHVSGSKGSISGNHAMENATLAVVIGSRAVCQADSSGIGYRSAEDVININGDLGDLTHYNRTVALPGDIGVVLGQLLDHLQATRGVDLAPKREWLDACAAKKAEWRRFKEERFDAPPLPDPVWGRPVLGQPAAIKVVADFAKSVGAAKFFDAGDVQANGFQIVEDDRTGDTWTDGGSSYMGFAVSALVASAAADQPRYGIAFTGDGSFMMNPQVLIDAVEHGARGMIVLFDNRRMAAISSLQHAQYKNEFRTNDSVPVDYVRLASAVEGVKAIHGGETRDSLRQALRAAHEHDGLSLVHVPIYGGDHPLGGLGAYGAWNVGNWCADVQRIYQNQDL
jgi:3D-(3,5/4)-trihydroxycyclohexane-1,2-dione acylhydrolase (decyclizing)